MQVLRMQFSDIERKSLTERFNWLFTTCMANEKMRKNSANTPFLHSFSDPYFIS